MHGWARLKKIETGLKLWFFENCSASKFFKVDWCCLQLQKLCSGDIFVCLGSLILSFTCNFFAYFKFHSDWGRLIGKIKQNKLDCRDTAPLKFVFCVARFLSMTRNPRTLQFHNKTKKHANNTNTEIWQCVDHTTIPEPVAKNQGNMNQDTVNE